MYIIYTQSVNTLYDGSYSRNKYQCDGFLLAV